jgi:hypothetical protein
MTSGAPGMPAAITAMGGVTETPTRCAPKLAHSVTAGSRSRERRCLSLQ